MKLLLFVSALLSCTQDYAVINSQEPETIVVTETITETETVEVEVEVPVYVEVEVPVNEGVIWIDSFTQHMSIDGIDILWVVDRSGSMNRFNADLLLGVEAMLGALPVSDWRLVMINADPTRAVTSNEFPLVPGDDIDDAAAMLATLTSAYLEEGFNAVYEYINHNPYSSTWMRPDAGLLVVFVSDEEEQSDIEYPNASDFISWYGSQRMGSVFMASVVNVKMEDSICDWGPSPINVGDRYMEATNLLGGVIVDICDSDWSPGVTDATHSVEPYENLQLTHKAEIDSIRVFIDGALNHDWYYQESDNTVYFTIIPSAGQLVEIGYRYIESDTGDTGS
ncbi:vWA domain-containing protein [uncultured Maribacter sp.]|uniref:vWA domain-containing protein n=1 Tax=uncultured Maribacter sp. TaxID=431308 RepID=UPI0030DA722E